MGDVERRSWDIENHMALQRLADDAAMVRRIAEDNVVSGVYSNHHSAGPYEYTPDYSGLEHELAAVSGQVSDVGSSIDNAVDELSEANLTLDCINEKAKALPRMEMQLEKGLKTQSWALGAAVINGAANIIGHVANVYYLRNLLETAQEQNTISTVGVMVSALGVKELGSVNKSLELGRKESIRSHRQTQAAVRGVEDVVMAGAVHAGGQRKEMMELQGAANVALDHLGNLVLTDAVLSAEQRREQIGLQRRAVSDLDQLVDHAWYAGGQRSQMMGLQEGTNRILEDIRAVGLLDAMHASKQRSEGNEALHRLGDIARADAQDSARQRDELIELQNEGNEALHRLGDIAYIEAEHSSWQRFAMMDMQSDSLRALLEIDRALEHGFDDLVFTLKSTGAVVMNVVAEGFEGVELQLREMNRQRRNESMMERELIQRAELAAQRRHAELISVVKRPYETRANEKYRFALMQYEAGNTRKALKEASEALDQMSTHVPCLVLAGRIAEDHALWSHAKDYYYTAVNLAIKSGDLAYFNEAIVRLVQVEWRVGNTRAALDVLIKARVKWGAEKYPDELLVLEYELDKSHSLKMVRELWWTRFETEIAGEKVEMPIPVTRQESDLMTQNELALLKIQKRYLSEPVQGKTIHVPLEVARSKMGRILEEAYELYFDILYHIDGISEQPKSKTIYKNNAIRVGGYLPLLEELQKGIQSIAEAGDDRAVFQAVSAFEKTLSSTQKEIDEKHGDLQQSDGRHMPAASNLSGGEGAWPMKMERNVYESDSMSGDERMAKVLDSNLDSGLENLRSSVREFAQYLYGLRFDFGAFSESVVSVPLPRFCHRSPSGSLSASGVDLARLEHRIFYENIFPEKADEPISINSEFLSQDLVEAIQRLYVIGYWVLLIDVTLEDPNLSRWYRMYMREGFTEFLGKKQEIEELLQHPKNSAEFVESFIAECSALYELVRGEFVDFDETTNLAVLISQCTRRHHGEDEEALIDIFGRRMHIDWPQLVGRHVTEAGSLSEFERLKKSQEVPEVAEDETIEELYLEHLEKKADRNQRIQDKLWRDQEWS